MRCRCDRQTIAKSFGAFAIGQRLSVHDHQDAQRLAIRPMQGLAAIAVDAHLHQHRIFRKELLDITLIRTETALDHGFTGRAREVVMEIVDRLPIDGEAQGANRMTVRFQRADEGKRHPQGVGQISGGGGKKTAQRSQPTTRPPDPPASPWPIARPVARRHPPAQDGAACPLVATTSCLPCQPDRPDGRSRISLGWCVLRIASGGCPAVGCR